MRPALAFALLLPGAILGGPAWGQNPAETGTGGGPASTIYAPNTTSTGTTKPPGRGAAPDTALDRPSTAERRDNKIEQGICIGCGAK